MARQRLIVLFFVLAAVSVPCLPGCGGGGGGGVTPPSTQVLFIYSMATAYRDDVLAKLNASGAFDAVGAHHAGIGTPSLGTLMGYDAVLVCSDDDLDDGAVLGDVLADYVDAGGGVVLGMFSLRNFVNLIPQGRFATGGYYCIGGATSSGPSSGPYGLSPVVPSHPILNGVSTFGGSTSSYRPFGASHVGGAFPVATWDDGAVTPLIATRVIGGTRRVDLGFYPVTQDAGRGDFIDPATDSLRIVVNALLWVAGEI